MERTDEIKRLDFCI